MILHQKATFTIFMDSITAMKKVNWSTTQLVKEYATQYCEIAHISGWLIANGFFVFRPPHVE